MKIQNRNKTRTGKTVSAKKLQSSLSWISAALFILGLAVIAGIYLERNSTISEVRFSGNHFTDSAELERSFSSPVGLHPDSVGFMELMDTVRTLPWIREAGIRMNAGGRMTVEVQERSPVALLIGSSRRTYIDSDGVVMPVIPGKSVNVPLLHGFDVNSESETVEGKEFNQVRDFLVAAKRSEIGWITISEVAYSHDEGVIALTHENGVKLLFGYGDFEQKIGYWQAFYRDVVREKGISSFSTVDIRYQNQIVTR